MTRRGFPAAAGAPDAANDALSGAAMPREPSKMLETRGGGWELWRRET